MRLALKLVAGAALSLTVLSGMSGAIAAPKADDGLILTAYTGNYLEIYDEKIYSSCRRKVRRELGPARGKHVKSLRLAFTQTCMINGGSHW